MRRRASFYWSELWDARAFLPAGLKGIMDIPLQPISGLVSFRMFASISARIPLKHWVRAAQRIVFM
jgi:hypothetical protein